MGAFGVRLGVIFEIAQTRPVSQVERWRGLFGQILRFDKWKDLPLGLTLRGILPHLLLFGLFSSVHTQRSLTP
jgi:hypothetical protein